MSDGNGGGGTPGIDQGKYNTIIGRVKSRLKESKDALLRLTKERDDLVKERDDFRARADESKLAQENKALRQKYRDHVHKARFVELAAESGADRADAAELYASAGYTPDADEPSDEALGARIGELKAHKTFGKLFAAPAPAPADAGKAAVEPPPKKPGPASGQAARQGGTGTPKVSAELLNDPKWVMNNYATYVAAHKEGTVQY